MASCLGAFSKITFKCFGQGQKTGSPVLLGFVTGIALGCAGTTEIPSVICRCSFPPTDSQLSLV